MSTAAQKPAATPTPLQLSATEFTAFIFPHLSMPKRGPQCKLGYHRLFNLILWVLYTGMQWKCLPVPQDAHGKPAIHYTTVYRAFAKWADDGSLWQAFGSTAQMFRNRHSLMERLGVCRVTSARKRNCTKTILFLIRILAEKSLRVW